MRMVGYDDGIIHNAFESLGRKNWSGIEKLSPEEIYVLGHCPELQNVRDMADISV